MASLRKSCNHVQIAAIDMVIPMSIMFLSFTVFGMVNWNWIKSLCNLVFIILIVCVDSGWMLFLKSRL